MEGDIINFFKKLYDKFINRDYIDVSTGDGGFLNFILIELKPSKDDPELAQYVFHYDSRFSEDDLFDFLEGSLCSLEMCLEEEFYEEENASVQSKKVQKSNLRVIKGSKDDKK